jgi:tetratricopeptide (TPR) repeat protein
MKPVFCLIFIFLVINSYSQTFQELTTSAGKAGAEKNYRQAIDLYNQALKMNKGNYIIYDKLGLMYYSLKSYDTAVMYTTMTLNVVPGDTTALYERAFSYREKKDFVKALDDFKLCYERTNRQNADACFNLGKAYADLRMFDEAIRYYQLTLILQPGDKYSLNELGYCFASLSKPDIDNALKYYDEAVAKDGNYEEAIYNRAVLYSGTMHLSKKAHRDLEKCIRIAPGNPEAYFLEALLYREQKKYDKARELYDKLIERHPELAKAYYERAFTWSEEGKNEKACKDIRQAQFLNFQIPETDLLRVGKICN